LTTRTSKRLLPISELDVGHIYTNSDAEDGQAQYDQLPPEAVDHLIAAFMHKVGLVRTLAKYNGPEVKNPNAIRTVADFESFW
jgi:hypothetical protein